MLSGVFYQVDVDTVRSSQVTKRFVNVMFIEVVMVL